MTMSEPERVERLGLMGAHLIRSIMDTVAAEAARGILG